jgi:hypothetical protein
MQLMLDRQVHLLAAEMEWLDAVIAKVRDAHDETGVQGGNEA